MPGPQFMHVQTFSRKPNPGGQSVDQVLHEAGRDLDHPEFLQHIPDPKPPNVILGMTPAEVLKAHEAMLEAGSVEVRLKDGRTAKRGVRHDRHTLLCCVASHPNLTKQVQDDPELRASYDEWIRLNVEFLKAQFGDRLVSVVEHTDEPHPHLHAYVLPLDDPSCSARELNPAWAAKTKAEEEAKKEGKEKVEILKAGNRAYKAAGRELQDAYHAAVGLPSGMTRIGPKRQRLTREQWKAAKAEAQRSAERLRDLDQGEEKLEAEAALIAAETLEERHRIAAEMLAEKQAVEAQKEQIRSEAQKLKEEARSEAQKMREAGQKEAEALKEAAMKDARTIKAAAQMEAQGVKAEALQIREKAQALVKETEKVRGELEQERKDLEVIRGSVLAQGVALGIRLVVGVLRGEVKWRSEERRTEIADPELKAAVGPLRLPLRKLVETVGEVFGGLKSLLSDREKAAEMKALAEKAAQAEAEAQKRAAEMRERQAKRPSRSWDVGPSR